MVYKTFFFQKRTQKEEKKNYINTYTLISRKIKKELIT